MPGMTLLIGIDEAGYGPNLGPLCIGASAWLAPTSASEAPAPDLFSLLEAIIAPSPDGERIAIADSKQLYKPGDGLGQLERGVLPLLRTASGGAATCWEQFVEATAADNGEQRRRYDWYRKFDCPLPIDAQREQLDALAGRFTEVSKAAGVQLVALRARLVFPQEFNELTEHFGTKGAALSHVSMELLRGVLDGVAERCEGGSPPTLTSRTLVTCDKHGGRNRYAALLQHHFPDAWIETFEESRPLSRYRWNEGDAPFEICFRSKGEAELPVALASMTAKYHRELAMRAFNEFWASRLPGLKPTAGYPQDAKRFRRDIAHVQAKLKIDDRVLWRNR